jgi:hypothetical protein
MTTRLTPRDWETLSAALDGQLKPKEIAHLEARLQVERDLQAAFEQLRRTRAALRSLPKARAPRNYTLSPARFAARQPLSRAYPALRLASALAMVLLALVVVGDFLSLSKPAALPVAAPLMAEVIETQVVMKEAAPVESPPAFAAAESAPYPPDEPMLEKSLAMTGTLTETFALTVPMTATESTEAAALAGAIAPQDTAESGARIFGQEAAPLEPVVTPTLVPPVAAPEQPAEQEEMKRGEGAVPSQHLPPSPAVNLFRLLEGGLLLIALVTGTAAIILKRRSGT